MTVRLVPLLALFLTTVGAVCLTTVNHVPYEWIRQWLDRSAADGSADAYTLAVHSAIVARMRYVGLALILLGAALYGLRGRIEAAGRRLRVAALELPADAAGEMRRVWSAGPPGHLVALGAIVSAGVGVRVWLLGWPMRYDESYTFLNYAREPLILGLTRYDTPNNHLFHTLLVHVTSRLLGDAPWVLRLPAFAAGVLVLPAAYAAVRALYGRNPALLGTAIMATSMAAIEISTNARGYSIVTLVFLLLVSLGTYLRRTGNDAGWVAFGALGVLGLYTIPIALYAFLSVAAWLLLCGWAGEVQPSRRRFLGALAWTVVGTAVAAGALYVPILIRTDIPTLLASPIVALKVRPLAWGEFLMGNAGKVVDAWARWTSDLPLWLRAAWLTGLVTALAMHRRVAKGHVPFVAGLVVGCVPLVILQRVVPPSRTWIFLWPILAGMSAAGVLFLLAAAVPRRWLGEQGWQRVTAGIALLLTVGSVPALPARSREYVYNLADFPGAERAVMVLAPQLRPGDTVLVLGLSLTPFLYYAGRHGLPHLSYVFDHVLKGWGPLRSARRIFIVVNERKHTLARVLAEAQLVDAPRPVEIAAIEAGHIYLITGE